MDPMTVDCVARVQDIAHRYGKAVALDGVSLDIPAQKMIGLIGPDGVGKSTLLGIIAGVRKLQKGQAEVLGGNIDDAGFRTLFAGTSVKRTGRDRFLRNVLTAIGNAVRSEPALAAAARRCLDDPSPLVRGAAIWALGRLAGPEQIAAEAEARRALEPDPEVRAEWQRLTAAAEVQ